jgi:uncharacterized protein (DUF2384 family)
LADRPRPGASGGDGSSASQPCGNFFFHWKVFGGSFSKEGGRSIPALAENPQLRSAQELVLTKAVLRAADKLDVKQAALGAILGVSEATVSRMKKGDYVLQADSKTFELAVLFIRLFRSLDEMVGGDEATARAWLANPNLALDAKPAEKIRTVPGLMNVIAYLDARKSLV